MTEKRFTIKEFSTLDAMASIDVICDEGIELPTSTACDLLNALHEENTRLKKERNHFERKKTEYLTEWNKSRIQNTELKNLIQEAYTNERTQIGRNTLKQLLEQI